MGLPPSVMGETAGGTSTAAKGPEPGPPPDQHSSRDALDLLKHPAATQPPSFFYARHVPQPSCARDVVPVSLQDLVLQEVGICLIVKAGAAVPKAGVLWRSGAVVTGQIGSLPWLRPCGRHGTELLRRPGG